MQISTGYLLNSVLLVTLSLMLVFPIAFSGFAINSKISPEIGAVLGVSDNNFDGNLEVLNVSGNGSARKVEFTVFPGQETYYREFVEVTNESSKERHYGIKVLKMGENISQGDVEFTFRRGRHEAVLSPGESTPLNLAIHGRDLKSSKLFKASITFTVYSSKNN